MDKNVKKIDTLKPDESANCWRVIGNDPIKIEYWKGIARLWKESLDVEVRKQGI